ncbi:MAG: hypothetical protein VX290_11230, partial [Candidatus Latescibacterota bacterium]|nr:hypothetical protein [Candidatus Latescibacterota bacterium]
MSAPARILVVEDEGIVGLDIQSKLEAMGYDVPTVVSTAQDSIASASAERLRPDLVLKPPCPESFYILFTIDTPVNNFRNLLKMKRDKFEMKKQNRYN